MCHNIGFSTHSYRFHFIKTQIWFDFLRIYLWSLSLKDDIQYWTVCKSLSFKCSCVSIKSIALVQPKGKQSMQKKYKKEEKLNQPGVKIQKKDQPLQEWKSPPGATSRCRRDTDHRKTHKSKRSNKFDKFHKFPATTHRHNKTRSNLPAQKSLRSDTK